MKKLLVLSIVLVFALSVVSSGYSNINQTFLGQGYSVDTFGLANGAALIVFMSDDPYALNFTYIDTDGTAQPTIQGALMLNQMPDKVIVSICEKVVHVTYSYSTGLYKPQLFYMRYDLPVSAGFNCRSNSTFLPLQSRN